MTRQLVLLIATALVTGSVSAQQTTSRNLRATGPTGTATITGVVETDTPPARGLRRAIVTLSGETLSAGVTTITDDEGRFAFGSLPAGRFTVGANKAAYLPMAFGAKRTGQPGVPIALAAGAREEITIQLPRGAVITGTVVDDRNRPAAGASVRVLDASMLNRNIPGGIVEADDRGVYRIYGLPSGAYFVAALPRQLGQGEIADRTLADMDALLAKLRRSRVVAPTPPTTATVTTSPLSSQRPVTLAPVYFPGTAVFGSAIAITVAQAEVKTDVDFAVAPTATCTISGVVTDSAPLGELQLLLVGGDGPHLGAATPDTAGGGPLLLARPGSDGRFTFANVTPGHYVITARGRAGGARAKSVVRETQLDSATGLPPAEGTWRYAQSDVTVADSDLTGVTLSLAPGAVLQGRIVTDPPLTESLPDADKIELSLAHPFRRSMTVTAGSGLIGGQLQPPPPVQAGRTGDFTISDIAPGDYQLHVALPSGLSGWWARSAMASDRDLLDAPISIVVGRDLNGVIVTLTKRHTELAGTLVDPAGGPTSSYVIIAFPANRALWLPGSRRIQLAQPGTDGAFSIADLPPGEYLVAALTSIDAGSLYEPVYLDEVAHESLAVVVRDGARTVQNLKISR